MAMRAVLFDFDGTLVETRSASWALFERTNREFALGIGTREQFFALFDDNFFAALTRHCGDAVRAADAARHFMDLVAASYHPPLIPGVAELVRQLSLHTILGIVSSNHQATIVRILRRAELRSPFSTILAGDFEPCKATAIRHFLDTPCARGAAPEEVVLITDTAGDVEAALAAGIGAWGVTWGMHGADRLLAAGAARVATAPQELGAWLAGRIVRTEGSAQCRI